MSEHTHLQNLAEQMSAKGYESTPLHYSKEVSLTNKSKVSKKVSRKKLVDNIAIQQLAYEIFQEKGGSDLDNWFEAEQTLNSDF